MGAGSWNHNVHYHRRILASLPSEAQTVLDAGAGTGQLARTLAVAGYDVTAIDCAADLAETPRVPGLTWITGDVLTYDFGTAFDAVISVAVLHHLPDLTAALRRLARLTADGGTLIVIGLARPTRPSDHLVHAAGAVVHRFQVIRHGWQTDRAPTCWPPLHSYAQVRHTAARLLPGAEFRRLPLWRYELRWRKPPAGAGVRPHT
ncbi:class I SAM-dependent methyltransferase [Brevibacterium sp. p3-SID960]|uniref:class I SAM-dependent methyltransferase n=1 Tax=Brevibacterium sp. p3-SID960 TaxID=2916063 RepID=UPI0021A4536E|nr:class I SAM-dependent methyltransferase [Brevibacterium sp. p3-SID960]MCT1690619.1 class I SAM-dependent methyltransferase [Brevibacterium sp. p3-SID960]